MDKKEFPNKVTKAFFFDNYSDQLSEKEIRRILNSYYELLGFNKRKRNVPDIIVINFLLAQGVPYGYKISKKIEIQIQKLGIPAIK